MVELLLLTNRGVTRASVAEDFTRSLVQWPTLQWTAWVGNQLAGIVAGRRDGRDPSIGWSDDLAVATPYRGASLGDLLIQRQIEAFRALGCRRVQGLSPTSHLRALPFFERNGFRVVGREVAAGLWGILDGEDVFITELQL